MIFFRISLYGIVAAMLIGGFSALAAADKPIPHKGDKLKPAVVTPQGGISFGESAPMTPAQQRKFLLKWQDMSQKEIDDLTATLKSVAKERGAPVMIVCKDPMCEDLALNLDNAFESARWKSEIVIGTQFGVPAGVTVSSRWLAGLLNAATGNRYDAKVEESAPPVVAPGMVQLGPVQQKSYTGEYILIGSKPR